MSTWVIESIEDLKNSPDYSLLQKIVVRGVYHPEIVRDPILHDLVQKNDPSIHEAFPTTETGRKLQNLFIRFWNEDKIYGGVGLRKIPKDSSVIVEVHDTIMPLYVLDLLKLPQGRVSTILLSGKVDEITEYSVDSKTELSTLDKIVVGEGCALNCENLDIDQLTLFNIRSAINLTKAKRIHSLTILTEVDERVDIPLPRGIRLLVVPESQDFNYEYSKTKLPEIVGFIPTKFMPSNFCRGIQTAREPFEKGNMDSESWGLVANRFLKVRS